MMDNSNWYKIYQATSRATVSSYKSRLLADFELYPEYEELASKFYFGEPGKLRAYVQNLSPISIAEPYSVTLDSTANPKFSFEQVDSLDCHLEICTFFAENPYFLFDVKTFRSMDEYWEELAATYFILKKDYVKRLDGLIVARLDNYAPNKTSKYFRMVGNTSKLVIDATRRRDRTSDISGYYFPDLSFEEGGLAIQIFPGADLCNLLFERAHVFMVYFGANWLMSNKPKEPLVTMDAGTGEVTVRNSPTYLARFNKFIGFAVECYLHYFKVFEDFMSEEFAPHFEARLSRQ